MTIKHITGLVAAPFTPMCKEGNLKLSVIPSYYRLLKANNICGVFINGSTGEGVSLTTEEKKATTKAWAECVNGNGSADFKVMALVGGNNIRTCIELAEYSKDHGLYAVGFTAPSYFKVSSVAMLADMCRAIGTSVPDLLFYYYHIPSLTGVNFPMIDLLKELDKNGFPSFAGIKYTHEDFMDFTSCLNYKDGKYDILWGRDECLLPALAVGAKGGIGSTYNYAAPLYNRIIDDHNSGDIQAARQNQMRAIEMIRLLGKYGGMATGKAYMKLIGFDCGEFRSPVKNLDTDQFAKFKQDAQALSFGEFQSLLPK